MPINNDTLIIVDLTSIILDFEENNSTVHQQHNIDYYYIFE